MSTQGMFVIVQDGAVRLKAVAGCNGQNTQALAEAIQEKWPGDPFETHERWYARWVETCARHLVQFGCEDCLVIMTERETLFDGELPESYRRTFTDPRFNPRIVGGKYDHLAVLDVDSISSVGLGRA